jgi:hypothetical protein
VPSPEPVARAIVAGRSHSQPRGSVEGSAKEQLNVNDQHVPEPIGAGFLRDKIPGLADEMQKWPVFLRDLEMNLHLRTFYFDRELPIRPRPLTGSVDVNQEAWAIGG